MSFILNRKILGALATIALACSVSAPAMAQGLIPWTYNSIFGTGPTYWGSNYSGSYAAPYGGYGYASTASYTPYAASYGGYGYGNCGGCQGGCNACGNAVNYGNVGCGCDSCGCADNCGCSNCGYVGGCASCGNNCSNCAAGNGVNPQAVPDPNAINPTQIKPKTYDNNSGLPEDHFKGVPRPNQNDKVMPSVNPNQYAPQAPAFQNPLKQPGNDDMIGPSGQPGGGNGANAAPLKYETEILAQVKIEHQRLGQLSLPPLPAMAHSPAGDRAIPITDRGDLNVVVR